MFDDILDEFDDLIKDVTDIKIIRDGQWFKLIEIYENLKYQWDIIKE